MVFRKVLSLFVFNVFVLLCEGKNPHIVFILADDLGWNDVSFHGSDQILTPNIDMLAYSGVSFGRYYTNPSCTPSRSALLSGVYAHKLGMQGFPLMMSEDRGIPTNIKLLPEYFKDAGYSTHLVGKWHVGSSRKEYLPTSRGFQSHFGHRSGYVDYYEYTYEETLCGQPVPGFALFRNNTAAWDVEGYITDVYNEQAITVIETHDASSPLFLMVAHNAPHTSSDWSALQAPPDEVRKLRHIEAPSRRMLGAMVKKLDDSVGDIVKSLDKKGILQDTIIVFAADNGGMTSTGIYHNYASNYPLRGIKMAPFEGGVRVVGLVWSANLNNTNHYYKGYMHVTDWLPTLLTAAGVKVPSNIDGLSQWNSINTNSDSQRKVIYEINDSDSYSSITYEDYKLITGTVDQSLSNYQGGNLRGIIGKEPDYLDGLLKGTVYKVFDSRNLTNNVDVMSIRNKTKIECGSVPKAMCYPDKRTVCLYNIIEDPCETTDLAKSRPDLVLALLIRLQSETMKRKSRKPTFNSIQASPRRFNNTWDVWVNTNSVNPTNRLLDRLSLGGLMKNNDCKE